MIENIFNKYVVMHTEKATDQRNVFISDKAGAFELAQNYYDENREQLSLKRHKSKDKMTVYNNEQSMRVMPFKKFKSLYPNDAATVIAHHSITSQDTSTDDTMIENNNEVCNSIYDKYVHNVVLWNEKLINGQRDVALCQMTDSESCQEVIDFVCRQLGKDVVVNAVEMGYNILPSSYCDFIIAKFPLFYKQWPKEASLLIESVENGQPMYVKHFPTNNPQLSNNE